jgi:hypothetical protein
LKPGGENWILPNAMARDLHKKCAKKLGCGLDSAWIRPEAPGVSRASQKILAVF